MKYLQIWLALQGILSLLVIALRLIMVFFRYLERKNLEATLKRDNEIKEILDKFESELSHSIPHFTSSSIPTPEVFRKHDAYLTIREQECDESISIATPTVVIQFNPNNRLIEIRLYVKEFYRSGNHSETMSIFNSFEPSDLGRAIEHAWNYYRVGFSISAS